MLLLCLSYIKSPNAGVRDGRCSNIVAKGDVKTQGEWGVLEMIRNITRESFSKKNSNCIHFTYFIVLLMACFDIRIVTLPLQFSHLTELMKPLNRGVNRKQQPSVTSRMGVLYFDANDSVTERRRSNFPHFECDVMFERPLSLAVKQYLERGIEGRII